MGLKTLLLRNHAKLAVPAFVGGSLFGFAYTLTHGKTPYQALKGEPAECRKQAGAQHPAGRLGAKGTGFCGRAVGREPKVAQSCPCRRGA
jgi:hypothetical protein